MAPRRTGKVRVEELQVKDDLAGARADGDHHHQKNKTQSNKFSLRLEIFNSVLDMFVGMLSVKISL